MKGENGPMPCLFKCVHGPTRVPNHMFLAHVAAVSGCLDIVYVPKTFCRGLTAPRSHSPTYLTHRHFVGRRRIGTRSTSSSWVRGTRTFECQPLMASRSIFGTWSSPDFHCTLGHTYTPMISGILSQECAKPSSTPRPHP